MANYHVIRLWLTCHTYFITALYCTIFFIISIEFNVVLSALQPLSYNRKLNTLEYIMKLSACCVHYSTSFIDWLLLTRNINIYVQRTYVFIFTCTHAMCSCIAYLNFSIYCLLLQFYSINWVINKIILICYTCRQCTI